MSAEVLFNTFSLDTAMERTGKISYLTFCQILQKVFRIEPKRKTTNKHKQTVYTLKRKNLEDPNRLRGQLFDEGELNTVLKNLHFHVVDTSTTSIKVNVPTGWTANGNQIYKEVTFNKDMTFTLNIRGQQIDLKSNEIDGTYRLTNEGINGAIQQINSIQLCQGIAVKNQKYRSHSNLLNEILSEQGNENQNVFIVRSKSCKQSSVLNNRQTPNCTTCQRMPIKLLDSETPSIRDTLKQLMPTASDTILTFLESQVANSKNKCSKQNRWNSTTINECLNLFTRSPEGYKSLRNSGLLLLPSPSHLIAYKNSVQQSPGFHEDIFRWMFEEAERLNIPAEGRVGGILIDEMSIQEKIEIVRQGDSLHMVGFVDLGVEGEAVDSIKSGTNKKELGTHVLQIMFMGLTGFRFPFAHFVSRTLSASHLYILFWEAVNILQDFGFTVKYVCMDGAVNNRSFMHIHFPDKEPSKHKMTTTCPNDPSQNLIFLMDPSHTFKKVRNNIIKSGNSKGHTRYIILPSGASVQWSMWVDAYKWDCQNPIKIHRKLTSEHLHPTTSSKMRNKLAEDVLDSEMLNLMLAYKDTMGDKGCQLDGAIDFLQKTSKLISVFRDKRPIHLIEDERLRELGQIEIWLKEWKDTSAGKTGKSTPIMSNQCMEDLQSTIQGFVQLCSTVFLEGNGQSIIPAMINSDPIENHFCQHRGKFNGLNTNPTALQYQRNANGIIIWQSAITKKSNTGGINIKPQNFTLATKQKVSVKRKIPSTDSQSSPIKVTRM